MPVPALAIQLLGEFRLNAGGTVITTVNTARLQSLLAYLVLHREAPQSRQQLAFLFWPDSSESQARTNLRNLYFALRHALPNADCFVLADSETLQWRAGAPFFLDVQVFQEAVAQACSTPEWSHAVESYTGDLLPAMYEDWILAERDRLHGQYVGALEHLAAQLESAGDYAAAIKSTRRLLQSEPLREDTYRRLMRLHALNGDRAGIVRVYSTCKTVLERELSIEPSAETLQSYENCLRLPVQKRTIESPARPAPAPNTNLPLVLTSFVGRQDQVNRLRQLIAEHRLVTLTGSGGVGKTRLALAVACDLIGMFPDGVWWADLAPLPDPVHVLQSIASALTVREQPGRSLLETCVSHVRERSMLLILDNCEHVVERVGRVAEALLHAAPHLHVLTTSRESLRIAGETVWHVPCLSIPDTRIMEPNSRTVGERLGTALMEYEAVQLFLDRATAALPTFGMTRENAHAIARICRRLDGIPLAIELAAPRVKILSVEQIDERLNDCFRLLTSGSRTAVPHHQSLRSTMDWSYCLLSDKEQSLLRRLAVFAGGFTLPAVEAVCADSYSELGERETIQATGPARVDQMEILDLVSSLQDKSLIEVEPQDGVVRSRLLEPVRQYALDKLAEAGEENATRTRHLDFFMRLSEEADRRIARKDVVAVSLLTAEYDNLRAALEWGQRDEDGWEKGLRVCAALGQFWENQVYLSEGRQWLARSLDLTRNTGNLLARARALAAAGQLAFLQGDHASAIELFSASLEIETNDESLTAQIHLKLGYALYRRSDYTSAVHHYEECIRLGQKNFDTVLVAWARMRLGIVYHEYGELERALECHRRSLADFLQAGELTLATAAQSNLARIHAQRCEYPEAIEYYTLVIGAYEGTHKYYNLCPNYISLGEILIEQGNYDGATDLLNKCLGVADRLNNDYMKAVALGNLATCSLSQGNPTSALGLGQQAMELISRVDAKDQAGAIYRKLGEIHAALGQHAQSETSFQTACQILEPINRKSELARLYSSYGKFLLGQANTRAQGIDYVRRALTIFQSLRAAKEVDKLETLLSGLTV